MNRIIYLLVFYSISVSGATFPQWFTTNTVSQIAAPADGWFLGWTNDPVWTLNAYALTNLNLIEATNNDTVVSNGLYAEIQGSTNGLVPNPLDTNAVTVAPADGWFLGWSNSPVWTLNANSLTNLNLINATNNDLLISNSLYIGIVSATNNALALATNNDLAVSNNLYLDIVSATNNALFLATNNDAAVSNNLYLEIVSATNNALALATNNDSAVSNNLYLEIVSSTNLLRYIPTVSGFGTNTTFYGTAQVGTNTTSGDVLIGPTNRIVVSGPGDSFLTGTAQSGQTANMLSLTGTNSALTAFGAGGGLTLGGAVPGPGSLVATGSIQIAFGAVGYIGLVASGNETNAAGSRVAYLSDGPNFTSIPMTAIVQPGVILTNGGTMAIIYSNTFGLDAAHALTLSNLTTGHVLQVGANSTISSVSSGAVPIDGDGTATTFAQVQALAPGVILTNGGTTAFTYSNNARIDIAHTLSLSNLTASRIVLSAADNTLVSAAASGAVPVDADGSATTAAQIAALVTINSSGFTNNVNAQSANYAIATTDWLVLLTGAHTATLPTAVGAGGRSYMVKCSSAGTNAILTTSSQTIDGSAKWTNTAVGKFTWVISDNANWRVIGQN